MFPLNILPPSCLSVLMFPHASLHPVLVFLPLVSRLSILSSSQTCLSFPTTADSQAPHSSLCHFWLGCYVLLSCYLFCFHTTVLSLQPLFEVHSNVPLRWNKSSILPPASQGALMTVLLKYSVSMGFFNT